MVRAQTDQEKKQARRDRNRAAVLAASAATTGGAKVNYQRIGRRLMGIVVSNDTLVSDRISAARLLLKHPDMFEQKGREAAPHFAVIPDRIVPPEIVALFQKDRAEWTEAQQAQMAAWEAEADHEAAAGATEYLEGK